METIKVIDLLNKIANEEEVPKIIKYNDYILYYTKDMKDYYDNEGNHPLLDTQCQFILNEEVEIIEDTLEDKKIEKFYFSVYQYQKLGGREVIEPLETKINEIIDKINGGEQ